ncbi:hypothetical protein [Bradyrhizobium sp. UFLA05-112]
MSILLTLPLVLAQNFEFGLSATRILMLTFPVNDQRLPRRQPPLSLNNVAFQLPQLIQEWIIQHRPKHHRLETAPAHLAGAVELLGSFG